MTDNDSHNRRGMWRARIPSIALMVIALAQVTLVKTGALCPWKGGGFGMFSTTDTTGVRSVRVFIERPALSEELEIAASETIFAIQAKLFPSDRLLTQLALAVASREQRYRRPLNAVRLEVWRTEFGIESLETQERLVRSFTYRVVQSAD